MAKRTKNPDIPQDQSFMNFFASLPEKPPTTMRFFERNNFYTVHGSDAVFVAKEIFKTLSVIKMIGLESNKTESVALSRLNFESLVREMLLIRQYRVEIYQNNSTSHTPNWSLEYKASPGNLTQLEHVLFASEASKVVESSGVVAIKIRTGVKEQVIGVAFADAILREFKICEFIDDSSLSNLEALVVQLSPKECLFMPNQDQNITNEMKQILHRNNVLLTESKLSDFSVDDVMQDLNNLVRSEEKAQISLESEQKLAISCLAAVVKYLQLTSEESNLGQFSLATYNSQNYMTLDGTAMRALGVLPEAAEENKSHSLLGLLNRCRTAQGQRLIAQWIKQPLLDINQIEERLDIVESFVNNTELRIALRDNFLRRIPDFQIIAKKIQRKKADIQDLYKVYTAVEHLPDLLNYLFKLTASDSILRQIFCEDIKERICDFEKYQALVKTVLDFDAIRNGQFTLKPECDEKLGKLDAVMKNIENQIKTHFDKVAKDLGLEANKTIKFENCKQIGYCFRVTRKEEKSLRNKKNYITIDTKQNGVRFYNPAVKELNEKYLKFRKSYEEYQTDMVQQVLEVAASFDAPMKQTGDALARLDAFLAFATAAFIAPKPYVRPKIREKGGKSIILKQARHPCLEMQPNICFIPNDVTLDKDKQHFFLVTGPNMGGKSTFIRSVALNVLMAQIGSFVPCDEADISIVDAILTRIGAGDKPLKGVSTFMAEMLEVKHILKCASSDSLIIMDELGRGTSTYDGLGLAWALSEHIATDLKSYCLFTTHFHELATLSKEVSSVGNLHVSAITSDENITFMYKVEPGVCDQSFGIHVAEMANFPKSVIEFAKRKIDELENIDTTDGKSNDTEKNKSKDSHDAIAKFLENAKNVPVSSSSEAMAAITELKHVFIQTTNQP